MRTSRRDVHVGGRFFGVSTRADGRVRANFLVDPGTGRRRRGGRTLLILTLVAGVALLLALAGCSGQRPTIGAAPPPEPVYSPAAGAATCADWTASAATSRDRAAWAGRLLDGQWKTLAPQVASALAGYCQQFPGEDLTASAQFVAACLNEPAPDRNNASGLRPNPCPAGS